MVCVLVNTGGVERFADYPPFLLRMFSDRRILPLPPLLRKVVAFSVATLRSPIAYRKYRKIGGSPILKIMRKQAEDLEKLLNIPVRYACLYSKPLLSDVLKVLSQEEVVVIPQYPQFSFTTTMAVVDMLMQVAPDSKIVTSYHDNPHFIEMWAGEIAKCSLNGVVVLFVAHGVPEKVLRMGDPYYRQVLESASLIAARLNLRHYRVAFQSRLTPGWAKPYVEDVMKDLSKSGYDSVLVVPLSFVNEHLETLYDLDIELASLAKDLGFKNYVRVSVPCESHLLYKCWMEVLKEAVPCRELLW